MEIAGINQSFIMAMAVIFMALGILYQVVIGVLYQRMIQSTDTLSGGDNKLLGQCKERFIQMFHQAHTHPCKPEPVHELVHEHTYIRDTAV